MIYSVQSQLIRMEEKQDALKENTDKRFTVLFDSLNEKVIPTFESIKWLKTILGGAWSIILLLVGAVVTLFLKKDF